MIGSAFYVAQPLLDLAIQSPQIVQRWLRPNDSVAACHMGCASLLQAQWAES